MTLSRYVPLCNALVLVLQPLVEVVIHDLGAGEICYINGNLSKRKVGDPSLLAANVLDDNLDHIVYPKINFDGRLIKSISVPLDGHWLICINADASVFHHMKSVSEAFLRTAESSQPDSLFKNDWQERLHVVIHDFLRQQGWHFAELTHQQKKILAKHLFDAGAFAEKNAADYVAHVLGLGRATVFNYLKKWRNG